jgi:alkylation response protein AidB-like acyl-CoA dehydrogenase
MNHSGSGLFDDGIDGPRASEFSGRVRAFVEKEIAPRSRCAEAERAFPAEIIRALGESGILLERWSPLPYGDLARAVLIAETMGGIGFGGIMAGVSLHTEAVISILARFGRSAVLRTWLESCLAGSAIGCIAASESAGGSDLSGIQTKLVPTGPGRWHLSGCKKYVSLAPVADLALVLARVADGGGTAPRLAMVAVPRQEMHVGHPYERLGVHSLGTAPVGFDTEISKDAIIGSAGAGIFIATHGFTHERLAIAAGVVASARLAINLAATHLRRRVQFGVPLMEHQALRLRLAELAAIADTLRTAIRGSAFAARATGHPNPRTAAGLKVTASRLSEKIISECMHLFGGAGYLEEETPLARMWRDCRVARIGAGTDEMMWEIVASGLTGDDHAYDAMVALT